MTSIPFGVGLFTDIPSLSVPAGTNRIKTTGRTREGIYAAEYFDATALLDPVTKLMPQPHARWQAASDKPTALQQLLAIQNRIGAWSNNNTHFWLIDESAQEVHAGHWGAFGDILYQQADGSVTLLDGTAPGAQHFSSDAIQAQTDWQNVIHQRTWRDRDVKVPSGVFILDKPIRFGYGGRYNSARLVGEGQIYATDHSGGTTFVCTFDSHPALNYSGTLWGGGSDFHLIGAARPWIYRNALATTPALPRHYQTQAVIDDTLLQNWFDPAKPNTDPRLRHKPYAGIAIDPFKGGWPTSDGGGQAVRYPELPLPAWLDATERTGTIYGDKGAISTGPQFDRVHVEGFAVGVAVQPGDTDANGDYVAFTHSHIGFCGVGWSAGNSQMRNLHWERVNTSRLHTIFATSLHGRRNGRFQGYVANSSCSEVIQLFDFRNQSAVVGESVFDNFTSENLWRIGNVNRGAASTAGIRFRAGNFGFNLQGGGTGERGYPRLLISNLDPQGYPGNLASIVFDGTGFDNYDFLLPFGINGVKLRGNNVISRYASAGGDGDLAKRAASNLLAGGVVLPQLSAGEDQDFYHIQLHATNLQQSQHVRSGARANWTSRDYPASLYCSSLRPREGTVDEALAPFRQATAMDRAGHAGTFDSATGTWTLIGSTLTEDQASFRGFRRGGVLMTLEGFIFVVTGLTVAGSNYTVTAKLQNGFRVEANGSYSYPEGGFDRTAGLFWGYGGGFFTPPYPTFFDTNQTTALSNVESANGADRVAPGGASAIQAGDFLFADNFVDPWFDNGYLASGPAGNRVAAVPASGQLTVALPATDTRTRRRLTLVQRAAA